MRTSAPQYMQSSKVMIEQSPFTAMLTDFTPIPGNVFVNISASSRVIVLVSGSYDILPVMASLRNFGALTEFTHMPAICIW